MHKPAATGTVTYAKDVAPIFNKHCVECHHPGEIGPFSLTSYDEAIGWTDTIDLVVRAGAYAAVARRPEVRPFRQ